MSVMEVSDSQSQQSHNCSAQDVTFSLTCLSLLWFLAAHSASCPECLRSNGLRLAPVKHRLQYFMYVSNLTHLKQSLPRLRLLTAHTDCSAQPSASYPMLRQGIVQGPVLRRWVYPGKGLHSTMLILRSDNLASYGQPHIRGASCAMVLPSFERNH